MAERTADSMRPEPAARRQFRSELDETKASFQTTELWFCVAAVIAVLVATWMLDNMNAWDGWRLVTALVIGYELSRGLAKAGSRHWGDS